MSRQTTPPMSIGKYQVFPPHSTVEFERLKRSIAKDGVLVPVVIDQHKNVIDGHHRIQAWNELRSEGVKVPNYTTTIRHLVSADEGFDLAVTLNERRRHL